MNQDKYRLSGKYTNIETKKYQIPEMARTIENPRMYKPVQRDASYKVQRDPKANIKRTILIAGALAVALAGGSAIASMPANEPLPETNLGTIYNDPDGFTYFESANDVEKYCQINGIDLTDVQYNQDSAGEVVVANSSIGIDKLGRTK